MIKRFFNKLNLLSKQSKGILLVILGIDLVITALIVSMMLNGFDMHLSLVAFVFFVTGCFFVADIVGKFLRSMKSFDCEECGGDCEECDCEEEVSMEVESLRKDFENFLNKN